MANCYNLSGDEIDCNQGNCIGPDCTSQLDPDWGLEGMGHWTEWHFEQWFEQLEDWGEAVTGYEAFETPSGEPVSFIEWEEAQELLGTFVGYDQFTELFYAGENAQQQHNLDETYTVWDMAAQDIIQRKKSRDLDMAETQKQMTETQNKYQKQTDELKLQETMLKTKDEKKDFLAARGSVDASGDKRAEEKLEKTVDRILDDYYGERGFRDTKLKRTLADIDSKTNIQSARMQHNKDVQQIAKLSNLNKKKLEMDLDLKERIHRLREDYETDIYNHLAEMVAMGSFVDAQPQATDAVIDMYCREFDTYGTCLEWGWADEYGGPEQHGNWGEGYENAVHEEQFCYCYNYTGDNAVPYWTTCGDYPTGSSIHCS